MFNKLLRGPAKWLLPFPRQHRSGGKLRVQGLKTDLFLVPKEAGVFHLSEIRAQPAGAPGGKSGQQPEKCVHQTEIVIQWRAEGRFYEP